MSICSLQMYICSLQMYIFSLKIEIIYHSRCYISALFPLYLFSFSMKIVKLYAGYVVHPDRWLADDDCHVKRVGAIIFPCEV